MKIPWGAEQRARSAGLLGICIASFLGCLDLTLVNTILPVVGRQFAAPLGDTQWIASSFMVALSAFMVPVGSLADRFGRKKALLLGLGLFGGASLWAGLATHLWLLVAARFVQGAACAILYTASGAIVSHTFGARDRGWALGMLFGSNGVGLALGPIVGGSFAGALGWRSAFLVNVPLVLLSAWLCARFAREGKARGDQPVDSKGSLLLLAGLLLLIAGLSMDESLLGGSHRLWLLGSALLALVLFARHEWTTPEPLVDFQLFRSPVFRSALLATFFLAFAYCVMLLTVPMLLVRRFGQTEIGIGWILLPATLSFAVASTWTGSLSERFGAPRITVLGLWLLALACALLVPAARSTQVHWFLVPMLIFGLGWGAVLGPATLVALSVFSQDKAAAAMGTSWTVHNVGGASGIAVAAFVVRAVADLDVGFQILMGLLTIVLAATSAAHLALRRGFPATTSC
jgi:EmrB/QacA subfamily drug resistance transporter